MEVASLQAPHVESEDSEQAGRIRSEAPPEMEASLQDGLDGVESGSSGREQSATLGAAPNEGEAWLGPTAGEAWLGVAVCKVYSLGSALLVVSRGSVVDFEGDAVVNAANKGCIGGGGVDRAIKNAGGPVLDKARWQLEVVPGTRSTRCPTGEARITVGGDLRARYCIHAVGPDYPVLMAKKGKKGLAECDALLTSAYRSSLGCAEAESLQTVAFCLLSAGIFRGVQSLENVLIAGLKGIQEGVYPELREVHVIAFTPPELAALGKCCDAMFQCA